MAKKIVVIGGGFAGLNFVQQLFKKKSYEVVLVDKNNYNFFTPLLYQVATCFLEPASICYPFRKLLRNKRVSFRMAELIRVDPANQVVYCSDGEMHYDHLVFAAGARTNFYGNQQIERNAISLKGMDDAMHMSNVLMKTMEEATVTRDAAERTKKLTMVVAGGGPTGVELAGMLAEMKDYILRKDYPELIGSHGGIFIVDGSQHLLAPMSEKTHAETKQALIDLGVRVRLGLQVKDYTDGVVTLSDGETIEAQTLIWAAGITALTFDGIPASSLGVGKRMITDAYNRVQGLENIWAIGDISVQYADPRYPKGHPQLAQVAIQQGRNTARNFLRLSKNRKLRSFNYFDRGEMAIVGRHHAVVDLFRHKMHVKGFAGLFICLFIHLISLVNYNNKLKTLYNWAVAYLTRDQALRMIFRSS